MYSPQSQQPLPGYMPQGAYPIYMPVPAQTNGAGIASMVLGILGMLTFWFWIVGLPISLVGLVLATVGMRRIEGRGFAIAGLVLSIIALVLTGCIALALISTFMRMSY